MGAATLAASERLVSRRTHWVVDWLDHMVRSACRTNTLKREAAVPIGAHGAAAGGTTGGPVVAPPGGELRSG